MSISTGGIGGLPPVAATDCEADGPDGCVKSHSASQWCSSLTGDPVLILTTVPCDGGDPTFITYDLTTGEVVPNGAVTACGEKDWETNTLCDVDPVTGQTLATVVQIFVYDEQTGELTRSLERADQPGVPYVVVGTLQACSGGQLQAITEAVCATDIADVSTALTAVILVDTLDGTVRHTYYIDAEGNIVTLAPTDTLLVGPCPGTSAITGDVNVLNFPASTEISNDTGNPVPVSGSVSVSNPGLTDAQLRAAAVDIQGSVSVSNLPAVQPVSGTVSVGNFPASTEISNDVGNPIPVSGSVAVTNPGLTDTQLRTTPVPVSGAVSVSNFPATQPVSGTVNIGTIPEVEVKNDVGNPLAVSGTVTVSNPTAAGLTDAQLRATPVPVAISSSVEVEVKNDSGNPLPVSGTVTVANPGLTDTQLRATAVPVTTGDLTNAQLRATPVPVSGTVAISNSSIEIANDVGNPVPVNGTVTANIGTTNGLALDSTLVGGTQRSKITDGTNNAAVKAASTAALATDPALVVAISPNNPITLSGEVEIKNDTGNPVPVNGTVTVGNASIAVTGPLTDAQLRATAVPVSGTVAVSNPGLTDTQLRATPVPVSGTVAISNSSIEIANDVGNPVPVNGTVSVGNFPATQPVSGTVAVNNFPVTQPVSGTVAISNSSIEIANDVGNPVLVNGTVIVGNASLAVTGPATDAQLRATPLPVSGTVAVSNPGLTDTQLRATPVPVAISSSVEVEVKNDSGNPLPVSGTVAVSNASLAVTGPLTDAQLRATAVPVSGTVVVNNFPATQAVTGPLTDVQLRATPVPVSGTVTTTGLTDTQLRASAVPVTDAPVLAAIKAQSTLNGTVATVGTTAAALPSQAAVLEQVFTSRLSNTAIIYLADSLAEDTAAAAFADLSPGDSIALKIDNANKVFAFSPTAGQILGIAST